MSEKKNLFSFADLINIAPDSSQVLQILLKLLISQLPDLKDVKIDLDLENLQNVPDNLTVREEIPDASGSDGLKKILVVESPNQDEIIGSPIGSQASLALAHCKQDKGQATEMLKFLNVSKRVEAVEVTLEKMTSMFDLFLKKRPEYRPEESEDSSCRSSFTSENPNESVNMEMASQISLRGTMVASKVFTISKQSFSRPSTSDLSRKKGAELVELPRILDFALCEPKRLLKVEKCVNEKLERWNEDQDGKKPDKSKLCVRLEDLREFDRCFKEQVDSVNLLISENLFYLENEICQLQKDLGEDKNNLDALASAFEDNEFKLNETIAELTKQMEATKQMEEIFEKHQIAFHSLKDFVSEINSSLQMRILLGAEKTWVQDLLENYARKEDLEEKVSNEEFDKFSVRFLEQLASLLSEQMRTNERMELLALDVCELKFAEDERKKELERQKRLKKKREMMEAATNQAEECPCYPCYITGRDGAIYRGNPVKCLKKTCNDK